jgi:hypothetical protein
LKEDKQREKAELTVIVSEVLPQNINHFGLDNGIWITDRDYAAGLACALRENLKALSSLKALNSGRESKAEMIYNAKYKIIGNNRINKRNAKAILFFVLGLGRINFIL